MAVVLSRRRFLSAAVAAGAFAGAPPIARAASPTSPSVANLGIIPGVIRWDAWYAQSGAPRRAQDNLGSARFQHRAPSFAIEDAPGHITATGTQADMDAEILAAHSAGIKYFAFDWYGAVPSGENSGPTTMGVGWTLYQSSPRIGLVNWCGIVFLGQLGALPWPATSQWQAATAQWTGYFGQSSYQNVLGNRPLLYLYWSRSDLKNYFAGSMANVAKMISNLREGCAGAGIGNPYIVLSGLFGQPSGGNLVREAIGADALGAYMPIIRNTAPGQPYSLLDSQTQAFWRNMAATGANIIPTCISGWDTRPRGARNYFVRASPSQFAGQLDEAEHFILSHQPACRSKAILIYSWNECDEGGNCLEPTKGDPLVGGTSNMLRTIGPMLQAAE